MPSAAIAAFLIFSFYEHEQIRLISNAISQARAMMAIVDQDFASTEAALLALGTSPDLRDDRLHSFYPQAVDVLKNMHADCISVIDIRGKLLLSTHSPFGEPLLKTTRILLPQSSLGSGKSSVSDLYIGAIEGRPIFTIGVPVRHDDSSIYSLNASILPSNISGILRRQKLSDNWRATIIDSSGHVVARTHDIEKFLGKKVSPELLQHMSLADEGGFENSTLDAIPVMTVYSRSPATKWSVVIGIPLDEIKTGLRQTFLWLVVATMVALSIGLAVAWLIGGNIARSFIALISPAMAIGSNETLSIPRLSFREPNQLGQALQDASNKLHQTQIKLRESDQRLALVLDAAHLGIWIRDLVRDEIWVSDQWRRLFEFPAEQRITLEQMLQRVHPDDRAAVSRTLINSLQNAPGYNIEYRIELPDGKLRWISSRGTVEYDNEGQAFLVRGISFDITSGKHTELDLQQKRREIIHLSRVTMLGELSGALAHELNQPLTAILTNAQAAQRFLVKGNVDLDEIGSILQDIVDDNKRAGEVIRRLRGLLTSGEIQTQPVNVNMLMSEVEKLLCSDLINQGVELGTEYANDLPCVIADPVQLQQVLINLIMNGCDAMSTRNMAERRIIVRIRRFEDANVQISVIDQGIGIPIGNFEKIFDAFYTTKAHGMGLGLAICRNIIEANGGRLWGENNHEGGASFHFCLPLHEMGTS